MEYFDEDSLDPYDLASDPIEADYPEGYDGAVVNESGQHLCLLSPGKEAASLFRWPLAKAGPDSTQELLSTIL